MAAPPLATDRITISDRIVDEARDTSPLKNASLVLRTDDNAEVDLSFDLQMVLLGALTSIANDRQ